MKEQVQKFLQKHSIDGWLIADHSKRNHLGIHALNLEGAHLTRRLFAYVPQHGEITYIVHAIEKHCVEHLEGIVKTYTGWHTLHKHLQDLLSHAQTVAMEYSPECQIPYVSLVDAGTIDYIRGLGVEVISSAPFLQEISCKLTKEQVTSHKNAAKALAETLETVWNEVAVGVTEYHIQQRIVELFTEKGVLTEESPICAAGPNTANPHYAPTKEGSRAFQKGDLILIDLWCKEAHEQAIYADVTQMGVLGAATERQQELFSATLRAQNEALALLNDRFRKNEIVKGFELDEVARDSLKEAGFGPYFSHRLGHNIYTSLHGPGAQLDSIETLDDRPLMRGTLFSIEPGVYIPGEGGIRLELDCYLPDEGMPILTTGQQEKLRELLV